MQDAHLHHSLDVVFERRSTLLVHVNRCFIVLYDTRRRKDTEKMRQRRSLLTKTNDAS